MKMTGVDFTAWVIGLLFSAVVVGLLLHMIKSWFDQVRLSFQELKDVVKEMANSVTTLFNRSEADRIAVKDCQLKAAATYATKEELKQLEHQVDTLFQSRRKMN